MPSEPENFTRCFTIVVGIEGGYTNNPSDPGNWTGGRMGAGLLKGTKFGISAAAYPHLDIASLGLADAKDIYKRDYWDVLYADLLPLEVALTVFDAAVNCGSARAIRWLQRAVGASNDGTMGPATMKAIEAAVIKAGDCFEICTEIQALRLVFLTGLSTWKTFGLGWARRICHLCSSARRIAEHPDKNQS